jgi:hypothetical protein
MKEVSILCQLMLLAQPIKKFVKEGSEIISVWGFYGTMAKKQKAIEFHVKTSTVQNLLLNTYKLVIINLDMIS